MKKILFFMALFALLIQTDKILAATRYVPADYTHIQDAIDASSSGDIILVSSGYYAEHLTLKSGVDVIGESPTNTYLSGGLSGSVVTAINVTDAEFSGFWIYLQRLG
ncbi:MAG: hypothetical protein KKC76_15605 [Proteobacteria bacterium]|nr:hypothetical protein [Pseudomonadota bacterium]MBU4294534.1 hypothetical protein [Pseudomonadota bacterium]MCG2747070.1 hypothetical protein [Desulfobulbaceae bacterium]